MYKVITADDENMVRLAMNTMIDWEANGFCFCGAASDGLQALALAEKHEPDLVITDIRMPNMDGLELIKALNENGFKGEILILSNYDDFELVRTGLRSGAYDYLLKVEISQETLPAKVREIKAVLDKKAGEKADRSHEEKLEKTRQQDKKNWEAFLLGDETVEEEELNFLLRIYVIRLWTRNSGRNEGIKEQAAEGILADVTRANEESFLFQSGADTYIFLDIGDKMLSTDIADKIQNQLELYLNLGCHVAYSGILAEKNQVKEACNSCITAVNALFYEDKATILHIPTVVLPWDLEVKRWGKSLEETLAAMLSCGNEVIAKTRLDQLLEEHKKARTAPEHLKSGLCHLLSGIYYILPYREEILWDIENGLRQIKEAAHYSQLKVIVHRFADECASKTGASKKEVVELKYYIDRHLNERLTLSHLKNQVNLSEKYMCTIFKQVTEKSIMGYINEKRMERVSELLLTTDMRMKEIGEEVGIPDQFYLSRLFKKHYGMSPTQYKNDNPYK